MSSADQSAFVSQTRAPATTFITKNIPSPTNLYVGDNDILRIVSQSVVSTCPFSVTYKIIRSDDGQIIIGSSTFTTPSDGSIQTNSVPLTEGFLLSVSVVPVPVGSNLRGTCFVSVQIGSGAPTAPQTAQILCQDYITNAYGIAWPGSAIKNSLDVHGFITRAVAGNPGAGAEFSFTVGAGQRWKLLWLYATLTTSAAAGNRTPRMQLRQGVNQVALFGPNGQQAPSTVVNWAATPGAAQPSLVGLTGGIALPSEVWLSSLSSPTVLGSLTGGLDAGDAWTQINSCWEQWIES